MTILVTDIETDGFKPRRVWCIGIADVNEPEKVTMYHGNGGDTPLGAGIERLLTADLVVMHNGTRYDIPHLERLHGVTFDRSKCYDTLVGSKAVFPSRARHALATWGDEFGLPKGEFKDFSRLSQAMLDYCARDVLITLVLFLHLEATIAAQEAEAAA